MANTSQLISTNELAQAADISQARASEVVILASQGKTWRGARLEVTSEVNAGGRGGKRYLVAVDSLPTALRDQLKAPKFPDQLAPLDALEHVSEKQRATAIMRREIVLNAQLNGDTATAAMTWQTDAGPKRFGVATIYEWQRKFATGGVVALVNKNRKDTHTRKCLVNRRFDALFLTSKPGKDKRLKSIATKIERHAGSMFRSSLRMSERVVARSCSQMLFDEALKAGLSADETALRKACELSRRWARPFAVKKHIANYELDRKQHDDKSKPRIARTVDGMAPMEVVYFDVHPVDILYLMTTGETVRVRLIGAQDHATRRLHAYPVFLGPGRGVRRGDVSEAFITMTQDREWGLPRTAYIDNGGEYNLFKEIADAMASISLPNTQTPLVNARPYNGSAKVIEGAFRRLENIMSGLPGWIGGDRMNQKTQTVGRPAKPFPGTPEELRERILEAVEIFNSEPMTDSRDRALRGRSPNQVYNAAVANGWQRIDISADTLHAVFATTQTRVVSQGSISIKGERYYSDALAQMFDGERVNVRIPVSGKSVAVMIEGPNGEPLGIAHPDVAFHPLDPSRAKEANRRVKLMSKRIAAERVGTPKIDTHAVRLADSRQSPPVAVPESGGMIRLSDTMEKNARAFGDDPRPDPDQIHPTIKEIKANSKKTMDEFFKTQRRLKNEGATAATVAPSKRHQND